MAPRAQLRWIAFGLSATGLVLLVIVQFVPIVGFSGNDFGITTQIDAHAWEVRAHAEGFNESIDHDTSWSDNDLDDEDGIGMVRTASPMLIASAVLLLAAAGLLALRLPAIAAIVAFVGAVVGAIALYLFVMGVEDVFNRHADRAVGFWLAIAASVLGAAAGVLALSAGRGGPPVADPSMGGPPPSG